MSNKALYQQFCDQEKEIPVFSRPWYLDAVCQSESENWDVILLEENGKIIASWPFMLRKKFGFLFNLTPKLTKFLGPFIIQRKRSKKNERKICEQLIDLLPKSIFFQQNFHYDFTDWLPFYWKGFEQSTSYSYVLNDLENLDQVYQNFSSDYRNNKIKKAEPIIKVVDDLDAQTFFEVAMMSFQRQKIPLPFDLDFFIKYDTVLAENKARKMFFAVDDQNKIHSVAYLLFDHDRVYFHIAGDNPDLRSSGASILLVWEAIKFTKNELGLNTFDFEGSMFKPIERVRRQFGATQIPYFEIKKYNSLTFKILDQIRRR